MRINDIKVSDNFKLYEFECKGSGQVKLDPDLLNKLQTLRTRLGRSIRITSGYRSSEHNKRIGGSPNSQHLLGKAADIQVTGLTPKQVAAEAEKIGFGGIGVYKTFVHVDTRAIRSRWNG